MTLIYNYSIINITKQINHKATEMKTAEIENFNLDMIKRRGYESEKSLKNSRRWQLMIRYLRSIGVK